MRRQSSVVAGSSNAVRRRMPLVAGALGACLPVFVLSFSGWSVASAAAAPLSTRYFTEIPNAIPDQRPLYDALADSVNAFITPLDVSRDGLDDIVIHYWTFANPFGIVNDAPCKDRLVVLVQRPDQTFVDETAVYISGPSRLGACSRKSVVADVNGDGVDDIVWATNQEDGRNSDNLEHIEAPTNALVSLAGGGHAVEAFGPANWNHAIGVGTDAAGRTFVASAGFTQPSQVFRREAGGAWLDIGNGFPATNASTFLFSRSPQSAITDELIQDAMYPNQFDVGGAYRDALGTWHPVADLRIFPYVGTVNVINWNGSITEGNPVHRVGDRYAATGAFDESCRFALSPGAPEMTVLKLAAGLLPGPYTGPDQLVDENDVVPTRQLFGFRLQDGALQQASLPIAGQQTAIAANFYSCADFNGDGYMDIAMFPYDAVGLPVVYINTTYGALRYIGKSQFPHRTTDWDNAGSTLLHDFDGDGIADVLSWPGSGRSSQYAADMDFYFYKGTRALPMSSRTATRDYDGDARSDVFWRNTRTGANVVWRAADSRERQAVRQVPNLEWKIVGVGDFDGDGTDDMLWRHDTTGANVYWPAGDSALALRIQSVQDPDWRVAGTGDFDADGRDDVFWRNAVTGANAIWQSANGATAQAMTRVSNLAWEVAGIGDFNGDGRDDLFWRNASTGGNAIWRSGSAANAQALPAVKVAWGLAGAGDFNGDGRDDLAWRHSATGANAIWWSASAVGSQLITGVANPDWRIAGIGDYNDDGESDLLWRNGRTGANVVWQSASAARQQSVLRVSDPEWTVVR